MRTVKTLIAAGLLAGVPAAANAQWYVGLDGGANYTRDTDVNFLGNSQKVEYDWGWVGLGQVGYAFGDALKGLKLEGEVGYRTNDLDKIGGLSADGDTSSWSLMANAIYEFLPDSKFHPFLGAGIGAAHVDTSGSLNGVSASGDEWVFAYQGIAGLAYDLNDNWSLKGQYRYFATLDYDVTGPANTKTELEYENHSVLVGFTYKFAPPPPPPPAPAPVVQPAPAPAPKPAPAPVQKNFQVFFDFNKADITPEASQIISQAATNAKKGAPAVITLTGHTDRSGSDKYNQALSLKRANAVKDELVKAGIPANQIDVIGKGESDPLVPTPDGVKEPQNRRVEIRLP